MNYVAKLVLRSMDTVMMAEDDDGKCFHRALCEFNKHSRTRKDTLKLWMPVWRYDFFLLLVQLGQS